MSENNPICEGNVCGVRTPEDLLSFTRLAASNNELVRLEGLAGKAALAKTQWSPSHVDLCKSMFAPRLSDSTDPWVRNISQEMLPIMSAVMSCEHELLIHQTLTKSSSKYSLNFRHLHSLKPLKEVVYLGRHVPTSFSLNENSWALIFIL